MQKKQVAMSLQLSRTWLPKLKSVEQMLGLPVEQLGMERPCCGRVDNECYEIT